MSTETSGFVMTRLSMDHGCHRVLAPAWHRFETTGIPDFKLVQLVVGGESGENLDAPECDTVRPAWRSWPGRTLPRLP
jgi:hypothetical protein